MLCFILGDNIIVSHSVCPLHNTFALHFTSRQLCRFTLYLVTSLFFFTSLCFSLYLETTLSFHFVPRHCIPFHITSFLFFTSLGDNFVVSLCTSSLHSCFSLHITFVFHFTSGPLCRFTLYLVTLVLFFTWHPFCFSLHLETALSFLFVPRHFIPFHITSLLFFTSLGNNFVVSLLYLITLLLFFTSHHFCFPLHLETTSWFHFAPCHFQDFTATHLFHFSLQFESASAFYFIPKYATLFFSFFFLTLHHFMLSLRFDSLILHLQSLNFFSLCVSLSFTSPFHFNFHMTWLNSLNITPPLLY